MFCASPVDKTLIIFRTKLLHTALFLLNTGVREVVDVMGIDTVEKVLPETGWNQKLMYKHMSSSPPTLNNFNESKHLS
jgi:hypothetical protein